jgi:hypothetical protein
MKKPFNIDEYIATFLADIGELLQLLRETVNQACPDAVETISYGMPAFKFAGAMLVWFAAHTSHIGFIRVDLPLRLFKRTFRDLKMQRGRYNSPSINLCLWN